MSTEEELTALAREKVQLQNKLRDEAFEHLDEALRLFTLAGTECEQIKIIGKQNFGICNVTVPFVTWYGQNLLGEGEST